LVDSVIEVGSVLARMSVGLVLVLAGIGKLRSDGSVFLKAILAFEIIPPWATRPVAKGLPWLEVALGTAMIAGVFTNVAALLSFALIATLTAVVIHALAKGKRVFCACFGFSAAQVAQVQWTMTIRNLVLLLACAVAELAHDGLRVDVALGLAHAAPPAIVVAAMAATTLTMLALVVAVRLGWNDVAKARVANV
jgi:uncharacterized membrane protein YphA (DoxX/SURF4 family)